MSDSSYMINVKVSNPERIGDGMKAYVRYTVITETNIPEYKDKSFTVNRRFREFHALYEKLVDLYREKGIIIPHPPEKSVTTSSKVKVTNKDVSELFGIELRRNQLETFINRLIRVNILVKDINTIDFLTSPITCVKARDNLLKLKTNITSTFTSLIPESEEYDKWYESRVEQIQSLEQCLLKLNYVSLDLYAYRRELIESYKKFIPSLSELKTSEQNENVSKAYDSICTLKEKACVLIDDLCINDINNLICISKDYLDDIISIKHLFTMYTKKFSEVKALASKINKLKEKEQRNQGLVDVNVSYSAEVNELEKRLDFNEKSLDIFYNTMKESHETYDNFRIRDTKDALLRHLNTFKEFQAEMIKLWEEAMPVCQAIQ